MSKKSSKGTASSAAKTDASDAPISVHLPDGLKSLGKLLQKQTEEPSTPAAGAVCQVHRCKFLDYKPHAILALAFNAAGDRLAVARDSGDIELWDVKHGLFCERVRTCCCWLCTQNSFSFAGNTGFWRSHCAVIGVGAWP